METEQLYKAVRSEREIEGGEPAPAREGASISPGEVGELLDLAEELREASERATYRLRMHALAWYLLVAVTIITGIEAWQAASPVVFGAFLAALAAALIFGHHLTLMGRASRTIRDQRPMYHLVEMLREIEPFLRDAPGWSILRREAFRVRLSRFGIGNPRTGHPN